MFRQVASRAGWVVLAVSCGPLWLAACSSSDAERAGGAGATSGGASSAGSSGASANAGSAAVSSTSAGANNEGPFTCGKARASCDSWTTFSRASTTSWGTGAFTGGVTTFGAKLTRDTSSDAIHVTGTVDDYGYGFGLFFLNCSDLSAYSGVRFKLSGSAGATSAMIFQLQTNSDYPWQAKPSDKKGACTATDSADPFGTCVAPSKSIPLEDGSVLWSELAGGMPSATASADEALGLQWAFPYDGTTAYAFDVTVSDVQLIDGTGVSCTGSAGGAGGAGGSGGSSAGEAGAGGA